MTQDTDLKTTYLIVGALNACIADLPQLLDLIVRVKAVCVTTEYHNPNNRDFPSAMTNQPVACTRLAQTGDFTAAHGMCTLDARDK